MPMARPSRYVSSLPMTTSTRLPNFASNSCMLTNEGVVCLTPFRLGMRGRAFSKKSTLLTAITHVKLSTCYFQAHDGLNKAQWTHKLLIIMTITLPFSMIDSDTVVELKKNVLCNNYIRKYWKTTTTSCEKLNNKIVQNSMTNYRWHQGQSTIILLAPAKWSAGNTDTSCIPRINEATTVLMSPEHPTCDYTTAAYVFSELGTVRS